MRSRINKRRGTQKVANQNPARDANGNSNNNQRRAHSPAPASPSRDTNPKSSTERCKPCQKQADEHWSVRTFAFVAAIGGLLAACFTGWQALIARNAEHIANRAYVTSSAFQLVNYGGKVNNETAWTLSPIIENVGSTSTKFLRLNEGISGGPGPTWNFETWFRSSPENVHIGPRSQTIGSEFRFNKAGSGVLNLGVVALGRASYYDIFDDLHFAEFCYAFLNRQMLIDWDNYPAGQTIRVPGGPFARCEGHNCEDSECGADWYKRAESMQQ